MCMTIQVALIALVLMGWFYCCCKKMTSCTNFTETCIAGSNSITLPNTIHVTFSNSGLCPTFDGQTFTLTWNGVSFWTTGSFTDAHGCTWEVRFECALGTYRVVLQPNGAFSISPSGF